MDEQGTWAERVDGWRASGLSSEQFCEGKPFTPGGLRHWAYRLKKTKARAGTPSAPMTLARVVPVKTPEPVLKSGDEPVARVISKEATAVVVELDDARVVVEPGFDRETLAAVFEVLRHGGSGR